MKISRKIVQIDEERCTGCGQCIPSCAEGALQVVDGKARLVSDVYCDGLGACLGNCPEDAIRVIEREAEEFDPDAVEEYLKDKERTQKDAEDAHVAEGCPSGRMHVFKPAPAGALDVHPDVEAPSALSHWPVQINLVPAKAPFLRGADLLVAADCTPVAYPNFHRDFLRGKVLMLGCPKFDNIQEYLKKFTEIFRVANIRSVTVLDMEVPCCSALPAIVRKAMADAQKEIPLEEVVISIRGKRIKGDVSAA